LIRLTVIGKAHDLSSGNVLALGASIKHELQALEESALLFTVSLPDKLGQGTELAAWFLASDLKRALLSSSIHKRLKQYTWSVPLGLKYDVASVLERETAVTITNWYSLVEGEPSLTRIKMSQENRCAHLPEMFRDLVSRLNKPLPLGTRALESYAANQHGKARREQGYTAAMIVEESRMLQVSIFQTLQRNVEDTQPGVLLLYIMVIADEVDSQLAQTMKSFIAPAD
jgi:hypothetical protein